MVDINKLEGVEELEVLTMTLCASDEVVGIKTNYSGRRDIQKADINEKALYIASLLTALKVDNFEPIFRAVELIGYADSVTIESLHRDDGTDISGGYLS